MIDNTAQQDIKPVSFLKKSEIAKRAETAEARAEAKKEADEKASVIRIVFGVSGQFPDGTRWERDATPEEENKYHEWIE